VHCRRLSAHTYPRLPVVSETGIDPALDGYVFHHSSYIESESDATRITQHVSLPCNMYMANLDLRGARDLQLIWLVGRSRLTAAPDRADARRASTPVVQSFHRRQGIPSTVVASYLVRSPSCPVSGGGTRALASLTHRRADDEVRRRTRSPILLDVELCSLD
jgi:hypothetical protein